MKLPTTLTRRLIMSYIHLTTYERGQIDCLYRLGWSIRAIAKELSRSHSTISREIRRNTVESRYCKEVAQVQYTERRKDCKPKGKWVQTLGQLIEEKLQETWSPEQIVGKLLQGHISVKTIYRWIYEGLVAKGNLILLRQKGKRRKPVEKRGRFKIGNSIHERPEKVKSREVFGHWELDTVVSGRGNSKGCFATFVERKTRMYAAIRMKDRTSESMKNAIHEVCNRYPAGTFRSMTVDRGKEFTCYNFVEKTLGLPMYFADAYCSWQRGSNENANGLLREFFPKATDLAKVTQAQLDSSLAYIMNRPRKCLNWKSSHEAFMDELVHLT
jgi:IS30 family transposase